MDPQPNYIPLQDSPLNITPSENGSIMKKGTTESINFISALKGWKLSSGGKAEFNEVTYLKVEGALTETNFYPLLVGRSHTIWESDGTTPDGNLTGRVGDICLGGTAGKLFYCSAAGKNDWVSTV